MFVLSVIELEVSDSEQTLIPGHKEQWIYVLSTFLEMTQGVIKKVEMILISSVQ
jgi:hypothetical protein